MVQQPLGAKPKQTVATTHVGIIVDLMTSSCLANVFHTFSTFHPTWQEKLFSPKWILFRDTIRCHPKNRSNNTIWLFQIFDDALWPEKCGTNLSAHDGLNLKRTLTRPILQASYLCTWLTFYLRQQTRAPGSSAIAVQPPQETLFNN